jgi:hypothetical protein
LVLPWDDPEFWDIVEPVASTMWEMYQLQDTFDYSRYRDVLAPTTKEQITSDELAQSFYIRDYTRDVEDGEQEWSAYMDAHPVDAPFALLQLATQWQT